MEAPFRIHTHMMFDDNVVKGLAQCVVAADARVCAGVGSFNLGLCVSTMRIFHMRLAVGRSQAAPAWR